MQATEVPCASRSARRADTRRPAFAGVAGAVFPRKCVAGGHVDDVRLRRQCPDGVGLRLGLLLAVC